MFVKKPHWLLRIPFWIWIAALLATQIDWSHDPYENTDSPKPPALAPAPPSLPAVQA